MPPVHPVAAFLRFYHKNRSKKQSLTTKPKSLLWMGNILLQVMGSSSPQASSIPTGADCIEPAPNPPNPALARLVQKAGKQREEMPRRHLVPLHREVLEAGQQRRPRECVQSPSFPRARKAKSRGLREQVTSKLLQAKKNRVDMVECSPLEENLKIRSSNAGGGVHLIGRIGQAKLELLVRVAGSSRQAERSCGEPALAQILQSDCRATCSCQRKTQTGCCVWLVSQTTKGSKMLENLECTLSAGTNEGFKMFGDP